MLGILAVSTNHFDFKLAQKFLGTWRFLLNGPRKPLNEFRCSLRLVFDIHSFLSSNPRSSVEADVIARMKSSRQTNWHSWFWKVLFSLGRALKPGCNSLAISASRCNQPCRASSSSLHAASTRGCPIVVRT